MKKTMHNFSFLKIFAGMVLIFLLTNFLAGQESMKAYDIYGRDAEAKISGASMVMVDPATNFPAHVRFADGKTVPDEAFLPFLKETFSFQQDYTFQLIQSRELANDLSLKAFQLEYQGIPIENAVVTAHLREGSVAWFSGFADHADHAPTTAVVSEAEALAAALDNIGAAKYMWEDAEEEAFLKKHLEDNEATYFPSGELILVKENKSSTDYLLAWKFDIREAAHRLDRTIFVDAINGNIIKWYTLVYDCDAGSVATTWHGTQTLNTDYDAGADNYILLDDCNTANIHTIMEAGSAEITDNDNDWSEADRTDFASTHYYGRVTMDYYAAVHSRASYDNANGNLTIRHVANWANGQHIGSGILRIGMNTGNQGEFYNTLDVIAHEFTHAVTADNGLGGLTYQGESGAINEGFSDILGETAEMWYENGAYTVDWLHREDYVNGENRSLIDPKANWQPDTYEGDNWAPTGALDPDHGGVHTNSGVMNHWFYLASAGGSGTNDNGDDYDVTGIGHVTTREIAYRMLTEEMIPSATFAFARNASLAITIDMFGDCSHEVKQITNAWYAVGVGDPYCEALLESPLNAGGYNIACNGGNDGSIDLTPLGTEPFTFLWDDGPTTEDRTDLTAGTYGVTMTDNTGCSDYATITLTEPSVLGLTAVVTSNYNGYAVSCNGASDGEATASASGGAPPYSYQWDANAGSQTSALATGLAAGTYEVTVSDANGCTATAQVILNEPDPLTIDAGENQTVYFGYPPAACATLEYSSVGGGVPPYTFEWSTGETTPEIEVCPEVSTEYTITLTDANDCEITDNVIVCAIDVRCGKKLDKVEICHYPPDNPANSHTICVSINAVATHLAEGDMLAACGTDHSCTGLDNKDLNLPAPPELSMELDIYPNPFTQNTTIAFSTETDGWASLRLIDAFGRVVATIHDGSVLCTESYHVELSKGNLQPGMYYCLLRQSNGATKVVKLLLN